MTTAAERAEARRKAILAKRGDRLAKLTTSARGDDASAYLHDDAPSFSRNFLGEEAGSDMPTPPRHSVSPSPSSTPSKPPATASSATPSTAATSTIKPESMFGDVDSSIWSPELQEQFRQALMSAASQPPPSSRVPSGASNRVPSFGPTAGVDGEQQPDDPLGDPFAPFLNGQQGKILEAYGKLMGGQPSATPSLVDRTKVTLSLFQMILSWLVLAYFVFWAEPVAYAQRVGTLDVGRWSRWAVLGENKDMLELLPTFQVHPAPFFWAFVALEMALRFFTIQATFAPSSILQSLLGMIPGFSNVVGIVSVALLFLNDLASTVFGLGVVVYFASLVK